MPFGIDESGFKLKRLPEIKTELEQAAREALGSDATLLPDSPEGVIIDIFSEIYTNLWEELLKAYTAFNPIAVSGQTLDNLVFLNGLARLPPTRSAAVVDITGTNNTIIPAGSIIRHNVTEVEFLTTVAVEIGVGFDSATAQVLVLARKNGAIDAGAGALDVIGSPVNGWATVTNTVDAIEGREGETDPELRARRNRSLAIAGSASLTSIVSGVSRVAAVSNVGGVENFTDVTDGNGLPPHSFEIVVTGGLDQSIAQQIWQKKPVGIEAHGTTTATVLDIFQNSHTIKFTRPTAITMYLRATISFVGSVPDDAELIITDSILAYVKGELIAGVEFLTGDDVVHSRMYTPINLAFVNHSVSSLELSIDGINWSTADRVIKFNEVSAWDASRITLTIG